MAETTVDRLLPTIITESLAFVVGEFGLSHDICEPIELIVKYRIHKLMGFDDYVDVYRDGEGIHIDIRLQGEERNYKAEYSTTVKLMKQS